MVVGLDVSHSVHASPVAGGTERGQYTAATSDRTNGGYGVPTHDSWVTVRDGRLCFDGADLVAVAGDAETPFCLLSERRLRHDIAALREAFGARCPRSEIVYASKACSNLWFLSVVRDVGINTLLEHTDYRWYFRINAAGRAGAPADTQIRLAGPLCDGVDVFAGDDDTPYRRFPAGTSVGDLVVFLDAGGYTLKTMDDYNARPRVGARALTLAGDVVEVRRRETSADLHAFDLTPGFDPWRRAVAPRGGRPEPAPRGKPSSVLRRPIAPARART